MDRMTLTQEFEKKSRENKIVSDAELRQHCKTLKQETLRPAEKFTLSLLAVQKPYVIMNAIAKTLFDSHFREGFTSNSYKWTNPKPSQKKERFTSGLGYAYIAALTQYPIVPEDLQQKLNKITLQSFDSCHDYAPKLKAKTITVAL